MSYVYFCVICGEKHIAKDNEYGQPAKQRDLPSPPGLIRYGEGEDEK